MGHIVKLVRVILVGLTFFIACSASFFWCLIFPFRPENMRWTGKLFAFFARPILGLRIELEHREHLEDAGPCIYISNHQDNLDLVVFGDILPRRTVTLGKKDILWIPIFGQVYWLYGSILIDRYNKKRAKLSMEKVTRSIREKKVSVWIMPEGTRSRGKGLLPFKKGAFRTAIDAQVPIVPICFNNYQVSMDLTRLRGNVVKGRVLSPVETQGLTREDLPDLVHQCHQQMKETIEELDREVAQNQSGPSDLSVPSGQ